MILRPCPTASWMCFGLQYTYKHRFRLLFMLKMNIFRNTVQCLHLRRNRFSHKRCRHTFTIVGSIIGKCKVRVCDVFEFGLKGCWKDKMTAYNVLLTIYLRRRAAMFPCIAHMICSKEGNQSRSSASCLHRHVYAQCMWWQWDIRIQLCCAEGDYC